MARGGMHHLGLTTRDLGASESPCHARVPGFPGIDKVHEEVGAMTVRFNASACAALYLQARSVLSSHRRHAPGDHAVFFEYPSGLEREFVHMPVVPD